MYDYLTYGLAVIGALVALTHALEPIVKLTKTDKDDALLSKVNAVLEKLQSVLLSVVTPKKS